MATLKFRRGNDFSLPSVSEPFFNTDNNTLLIGTGSEGHITLVKLGANTGSVEFTGDITGSNLLLSGDITARDVNARNVVLSGDIFLGDGNQSTDNIYVNASFSGSLLPDTDIVYNIGNENFRYKEIHSLSGSFENITLNTTRILSSSINEYQDFDTFSSSVDLRLDNAEWTGSNQETRLDILEGPFSTSVDDRLGLLENFSSSEYQNDSSSFDSRLDDVEFTSSNQEFRIDNLELSQSYFDNTFSGSVDSRLDLLENFSSSEYQSDSSSFDSRLDTLEGSFSSSVDERLDLLENFSSSEYQSDSSSFDSRLDDVEFTSSNQEFRIVDLEITGSDQEFRLDNLELSQSYFDNTFSGSVDLRLDDAELTGSDHESRITSIEGYSASLDSRLDDLEATGSNHESRIDIIETTFSSSVDSRLSELEGPFSSSVNQQLESIHLYTSSLKTAIDVSGQNLTVFGDLLVQGTTTTINTEELIVEDSLLAIASGSTTSAESDGAGFFISGANASILWNHPNQLLEFNTKISSSIGFKGDGSELINIPSNGIVFDGSGIVSGSSQVTESLDLRYLEIEGDGVVSGSSQVTESLDLRYLEIEGDSVVSGSDQVTESLDLRYLEIDGDSVVSGSSQVTESLDLRYLEIDGDSVVSSSVQIDVELTTNFQTYSQSVDFRITSLQNFTESINTRVDDLETFSASLDLRYLEAEGDSVVSGSDQVTQSLDLRYEPIGSGTNTLVSSSIISTNEQGSFTASINGIETNIDLGLNENDIPIFDNLSLTGLPSLGSGEVNAVFSGSAGQLGTRALGTAAFLNVSQSVGDDPNSIPTNKAVSDALILAGAGDITAVNDSTLYTPDYLGLEHTGDGTLNGGYGQNGNVVIGLATGSLKFTEGVGKALPSGVISGSTFINFSSSVDLRLDELELFSSSLDDDYITHPELASATQSLNDLIDTKLDTGSYNTDSSSFDIRIDSLENENNENPLTFSDTTTIKFTRNVDTITADVIGGIVSSSQQISDYNTFLEINSDDVVSGSSQVDLTQTTNYVSGIKTRLNTEGVISGSSQVDLTQTTNYISGIKTRLDAEGVISGSSQIIGGSGIVSSSQQISNYNTFLEINGMGVVSGSDQLSGSLVTLDTDQTISGTKTFNDIVVNGTGSFAYITSVGGDAKIIGDAFVVVNTATPTSRYAGLSVYDSGSTLSTASFQFDGQTNDWHYEYSSSAGIDYGVAIFGPEYDTKGNPTYLTDNIIPKATDNHHIVDSNISDNGTTVTLNSNTQINGTLDVTGVITGDGSGLTNLPGSSVTLGGDVTGTANANTVGKIQGIAITSDEATQLANINTTTISTTQWGYVGALNQGLTQTSEVQFGKVGVGGASDATYELKVTGDIGATGDVVAYVSSDRRLKDEITPIENSLQKINSIGGYSFVWNEKSNIYKGKDYGVIAQEIEEILPELVETRENGYKAVKYDRIVSLLIEGVKELSKEVSELKKEIGK